MTDLVRYSKIFQSQSHLLLLLALANSFLVANILIKRVDFHERLQERVSLK